VARREQTLDGTFSITPRNTTGMSSEDTVTKPGDDVNNMTSDCEVINSRQPNGMPTQVDELHVARKRKCMQVSQLFEAASHDLSVTINFINVQVIQVIECEY
jgi:hypothetical protein